MTWYIFWCFSYPKWSSWMKPVGISLALVLKLWLSLSLLLSLQLLFLSCLFLWLCWRYYFFWQINYFKNLFFKYFPISFCVNWRGITLGHMKIISNGQETRQIFKIINGCSSCCWKCFWTNLYERPCLQQRLSLRNTSNCGFRRPEGETTREEGRVAKVKTRKREKTHKKDTKWRGAKSIGIMEKVSGERTERQAVYETRTDKNAQTTKPMRRE